MLAQTGAWGTKIWPPQRHRPSDVLGKFLARMILLQRAQASRPPRETSSSVAAAGTSLRRRIWGSVLPPTS